jgi:hypothetical protein
LSTNGPREAKASHMHGFVPPDFLIPIPHKIDGLESGSCDFTVNHHGMDWCGA